MTREPSAPETIAEKSQENNILKRNILFVNRFKIIGISLGWTFELGSYIKRFFAYLAFKINVFFQPGWYFTYDEVSLSPETEQTLANISRKTLVLDLDETLIHSCYNDPDTNDSVGCSQVPDQAVPDFIITVDIEEISSITFQVYKRPHVDEFLDFVSKWYDLVIYTASLEEYASEVVDRLDAGRGILPRRFYRQHCRSSTTFLCKDLNLVNEDLCSTIIIDNSPNAYRDFPENAIPIKAFIYDPNDKELVKLLPFLDALRFTKDVRTILGRRSLI
ncbi:CTD nuclear envelope phosphatase 1 [Drosophila tropicalis]|uniref:CTD nuclear envelope phosphatase 1 n=1 Tax=Drosophila tropicalis TaxID=46794 RepID=UPI0035ABFDA6